MDSQNKVTVSNDIAAITDRVMHRQLIPVDRSHAEALVRMVLESAAEALAEAEPGRIDGIVSSITRDPGSASRATVHLSTGSGIRSFLASPALDVSGLRWNHHAALRVKDDPAGVTVLVQFNNLGKADGFS